MAEKVVKVKVTKMFRDKKNGNNWVGRDHELEVSEARADELVEKGVVEIMEDELKEKKEMPAKLSKEKKEITKP